MKKYELNAYGSVIPISLSKSTYEYNGSLAIAMTSYSEGYAEPWDNLTVCLDQQPSNACCAFVKSDEWHKYPEFLERNAIAVPTGVIATSGYNIYPEYRFSAEVLAEMDEQC